MAVGQIQQSALAGDCSMLDWRPESVSIPSCFRTFYVTFYVRLGIDCPESVEARKRWSKEALERHALLMYM